MLRGELWGVGCLLGCLGRCVADMVVSAEEVNQTAQRRCASVVVFALEVSARSLLLHVLTFITNGGGALLLAQVGVFAAFVVVEEAEEAAERYAVGGGHVGRTALYVNARELRQYLAYLAQYFRLAKLREVARKGEPLGVDLAERLAPCLVICYFYLVAVVAAGVANVL